MIIKSALNPCPEKTNEKDLQRRDLEHASG
jgi:hypothetical protein